MAVRLGIVVADLLALGEAELLAHQVDAGDLFGDRVLDLQPGVHLEERDRAVGSDEELAGARSDVADFAQDRLGGRVEDVVLRLGEERRGRLLDELLVAALQRAVARRDDDDVARGIREALRLDVTRLVEVLLDEALAAAEGGDRLARGGLEQLGDLVGGPGDLEAAPAAAVGGLDRDRQAVLCDEGEHVVGAGHRTGRARRERRADLLGDVTGGDLVAEGLDGLGARADPDEPGADDGAREVGVLGEEPVAGVHGVGARSGGRSRGSSRSRGRCRRSCVPSRAYASSARRACRASRSWSA